MMASHYLLWKRHKKLYIKYCFSKLGTKKKKNRLTKVSNINPQYPLRVQTRPVGAMGRYEEKEEAIKRQ